jgi:hypothetical protein
MKTPDTQPAADKYIPENLEPWETPDSWFGQPWEGYYVFLGRNRDSDCLVESNFRSALRAIGGEQTADDEEETPLVTVVREGHWACGWIEWIAIHESATEALMEADAIAAALTDYPIVDESDFSELETEEAERVWRDCYDAKDRVAYVRRNRSQFDFSDLSDMLGCIRGKYFAGYPSELLY